MKLRDQSPLSKIILPTYQERENTKPSQRSSCGGNIEEIIHKKNAIGKSALLGGGGSAKEGFSSAAATTTFDNIGSIKVNNEKEQNEIKQGQIQKGSVQVMKQIILASPSHTREEIYHLKGKKLTQRKVIELAQIKTKQLPPHMIQYEQQSQPNQIQQNQNNALIQKESQMPSKFLSNISSNNPTINLSNINQNIINIASPPQAQQYGNQILQDTSNFESFNIRNQSPLHSPKRYHLQTQGSPSSSGRSPILQYTRNHSHLISEEKSNCYSMLQTNEQSLKTSPIRIPKYSTIEEGRGECSLQLLISNRKQKVADSTIYRLTLNENQIQISLINENFLFYIQENDQMIQNEESNPKRKFYKVSISYFVDPNFPQISNNKNLSLKARDQQYVAFTNKLKSRSNQGNSQKFYSNVERQPVKHAASLHQDYHTPENRTNLPSLLHGSDTSTANSSSAYKKAPIVFPSFPLNPDEQIDSKCNLESTANKTTKNLKINYLRKLNPLTTKENCSNVDNLNAYQQQQRSQHKKNSFGNSNNDSFRNQGSNQTFDNSSNDRQMGMAILRKQFQRTRLNTFSENTKSNLLPNPFGKSYTESDEQYEENEQEGNKSFLNNNNSHSSHLSSLFQNRQFYQQNNNDDKEENLSKFIFNSQLLKAGNHPIADHKDSSLDCQQNQDQMQKIQEIYQIEAFKEINFQTLRYYYDQKYHQKLVLSPPKLTESERRRTQHIEFNIQHRPKVLSLHDSFQPPQDLFEKLYTAQSNMHVKNISQFQSPQRHNIDMLSEKQISLDNKNNHIFTNQTSKEDNNNNNNTLSAKKSTLNENIKNEQNRNQQLLNQQNSINSDDQEQLLKQLPQLDYVDSTLTTTAKTYNKKTNNSQRYHSKLRQQHKEQLDFEKLEPWDNQDKFNTFEEDQFHNFNE